MKKIGITGCFGKTSVAEIIYQYLAFTGHKTTLYSSNGFFINGNTKTKDFLGSTPSRDLLFTAFQNEEKAGVNYAVVEMTAESYKRNPYITNLGFDVMALTGYDKFAFTDFLNNEEYLICLKSLLNSAKYVIVNHEYEKVFNYDRTFGVDIASADVNIELHDNIGEGLSFHYKGDLFHTNLIGSFHLQNLACVIAVLKTIGKFDVKLFKNFLENGIIIRGRLELFNVDNKTVVLDVGNVGLNKLYTTLEEIFPEKKVRLIYLVDPEYAKKTLSAETYRMREKPYFNKVTHIYLVDEKSDKLFKDFFVDENFENYTFFEDKKKAYDNAFADLKENEILLILSRKHFRKFREIIKKEMEEEKQ